MGSSRSAFQGIVAANTQPPERITVIYRILDANLDRSREGLRVIEEWCRFGIENSTLTEECKQMRHTLASWHTPEIRAERNTPGDLGTALTHPQEESRSSIEQVLLANFGRIQEALRAIEEYGKLVDPTLSGAAKQMRYRAYTIESRLLGRDLHRRLENCWLYLVTSAQENLFEVVEAALQGGLRLVQYRDKQAEDSERLSRAERLRQLCDRYGALFLVNDRVDLALALGADGVHLGQQDAPIALARRLLGARAIIGRSTTNPQEMERAIAQGADYIGVGPVYPTPTKAEKAAAGLDYVQYAAQHSPVPFFAIGGINTGNIAEVVRAGAQRVAVVRAIMEAEEPTIATQRLVGFLNSIRN